LIVADASAVLEVLLNTPAGTEIARHIFAEGETIHVPHLVDVEILHALRRLDKAAEIRPARISEILQDYFDMLLTRYPHSILIPRIWELRRNWTSYDAAYIALAEELAAPLITRDRAMAANSGHRARVILI
jgi:predicted nucleic acid-binding protein